MTTKTHIPILTTLAGIALAAAANGQLINDGFESYTAGTSLDTSGPWATVTKGSLDFFIVDDSTATFGTPNQYFDLNDDDTSSVGVFSPQLVAASDAVTTFLFDFNEPSTGGGGDLILGYTNGGGDLNGSGARIRMNLDDGTIEGPTGGANTYSLDTTNRIYVVFNDTISGVDYNGGSNTVASETADVWIQPSGGPAVFAGTVNPTNTFTPAYRVGFRSFSTNLQQVLLDNVSLNQGILLPGNPPALATTSPEDNDTGVFAYADLVANFDKPVAPGSGFITIKETVGDATVVSLAATDPAVTFSGTSVTVDLPSDLGLTTEYYVLVDANAIESTVGDPFLGIAANDWSFTTNADSTLPSLVTTTPDDDATGVALGTDLVVTFDEPIAAGTGNIVITNLTESTTFATIDITDATQVDITGSTLTIDPTGDLLAGRSYAVEIASGAIVDAVANAFPGISGTTAWDFATIPDTTDPTLVSTNPGNNSTRASVFNNLTANFDEAIKAGSGNIVIKNLTDATTIETFAVGDPQVTISGNTLTLNPSVNLAVASNHAIQIEAGAITDLSDNAFAGILDDTTWSFLSSFLDSRDHITGERQDSGQALGYYPSSGSSSVGTGGSTGARDHRNVVLGMALPTLPVGESLSGATFEFEITQGFDATGGANLPDLQVYLLNTADPDATGDSFFFQGASDPSPDAKLVDATSVTISGTGSTDFPDDQEDRVMTLTGDALALMQTFYGGDHVPDQSEAFFRFNLGDTIAVNSIRRYRIDTNSNEADIQVTSELATDPALVSTFPADDAIGVFPTTNLVASFDELIQAGTGDIIIRDLSDSSIFATIAVTDGSQVSISGTELIIDPSAPLDEGTNYAVHLEPGLVTDLAGNPVDGILASDVTSWNFQTGLVLTGSQASADSIRGRALSLPLDYLVDSSEGGRVGNGGGSTTRRDFNIVLGFTLPTLAVGETLSKASLDFEITQSRGNMFDPGLNVYLLDTANPDSSGVSFFYHGPSDPNPDVEFVGATNLVESGTGSITYADDEQDQTYDVTGDALALLQSFYGGDHIPDQAEVFFRFNLDQLLGGETLNTFERYFIDMASDESLLTIVSTAVGGGASAFDSWASDNGLDGTSGKENGSNDDPENDGKSNLYEFAFDGDPLSGADQGKVFLQTNDGIDDKLILTIAVRSGAPVFSGSPSPSAVVDGITYTVEGSTDLSDFTSPVSVITPITTGLPTPSTGYEYRSFSLDGSTNLPNIGFLRASATE